LHELDMKTEIWIVYRLFDYEDDFKWKNFELQSCRSGRKLQCLYKIYLHPSSNKQKCNFLKTDRTLTAMAMAVAVATVPRVYLPSWGTAVGHASIPHDARCIILQKKSRPYIFAKKRKEKCKNKKIHHPLSSPTSSPLLLELGPSPPARRPWPRSEPRAPPPRAGRALRTTDHGHGVELRRTCWPRASSFVAAALLCPARSPTNGRPTLPRQPVGCVFQKILQNADKK
jgi:hypothetical protein